MMKRTIVFLLVVSAVVLMASGAQIVSGSKKKAQAQAVKTSELKGDAQTQAVSVIHHPPDGWTTPVNISNLPAESNLPSIAVDDNGKVYATWEEWYGGVGAPRAMCFNTNVTGQWGTSQQNYLLYDTIDDVGFPAVACDPFNGTGYIAYHDGDFAHGNMEVWFVEYARGVKTSGGWISLTPGPSDYANMAVNPKDGTVYVMWFDDVTDTTTWELLYRWRDPSTKQWSGPLQVPVFVGRSKYWRDMVIDKNGTAHLAFILRSPTEVWYTKNPTPQNSGTWTSPVPISGNTDRNWAMPRIAADNAGDAYIVWHANTGGYETATEEVMFRKSVSGVWQPAENLSNSPTRSEGEVIAVDPQTKDIYVVWNELVSEGNWEVYLRMYSEATKSWGDIYDMTNDAFHSAEPFIRMDAKKGLHIVYHDYIGANREIMYTYKQGINVNPPLSFAVDSALSSDEATKTNTLTWAQNPANASVTVANYKIYRKPASAADSAFAPIATPGTSTFQYADSVGATGRYAYRMTSLLADGTESAPTAAAQDKAGVFAPTNVAISSRVNKILFYEIRDTTITFVLNPNNAPADVDGYNIYRRKATTNNSAMSLLGAVGASTFNYKDAGIRGGQKYAYAVKTKFRDGRESGFSAVVTEK
jgi:hypothetical protein